MAVTNLTSGILSTISQSGWFEVDTAHMTAIVALPMYILSGTESYLSKQAKNNFTGANPPLPVFGNFPAGSGLLSGAQLFYTVFFWTDR